MRRARWLWLSAIAAGVVLAQQAAAPVVMGWLRSSRHSTADCLAQSQAASAELAQLYDVARWQWTLALRHADHQRLGDVWLANERLLDRVEDQQARNLYFQELMAAHQTHFQAVANAWQTWIQDTQAANQRAMQAYQTNWQTLSNQLQQDIQRLQAELQRGGEPEELPMPDLTAALAPPDLKAAEAAMRQTVETAGATLAEAVAAADKAWIDEMAEAADPEADLAEVERIFDRASRAWQRATADALDTYRDSSRKAVRDYIMAAEEALDAP